MPNDDKITVQHVVDWSDHSNEYTQTQRDTAKFTSVTVKELKKKCAQNNIIIE